MDIFIGNIFVFHYLINNWIGYFDKAIILEKENFTGEQKNASFWGPFQSKQRTAPAWIILTNSEDEAFLHVTKLEAYFESNSEFNSFLQKQGDGLPFRNNRFNCVSINF